MHQALQLTLEQVARDLDLSESVVLRLAQYFDVPRKYYKAPSGQPRLMLFSPQEVDILRQTKASLLAGRSLPEIKQSLAHALIYLDRPEVLEPLSPRSASAGHPAEETSEEELPLIEYEQDHALKQYLAQETFRQYRHNNEAPEAPFQRLAQALKKEPTLQAFESMPTKSSLGYVSPPSTTIFPRLEAPQPEPLPSDLKNRILELKQQLLPIPASNNLV